MAIVVNNDKQYHIDDVIPSHVRERSDNLYVFLEAYYEWMQQSQTDPGHILNNLSEYRDIDNVSDIFIKYLQREFAAYIPESIQADKRKLYKQVNDLYRSKGSALSYEALFRVIFDETIELYYPRVDILKPSDGKWDIATQRFLNNDGFISDKKYIQDSYYYQNFSYVIKTGQTIDKWRDVVKKVLHPAGFAFFGQVTIISQAVNSIKLPTQQLPVFINDFSYVPVNSGPVFLSQIIGKPVVFDYERSFSEQSIAVDNGLARTTDYVEDILYFAEDYVGISRAFT